MCLRNPEEDGKEVNFLRRPNERGLVLLLFKVFNIVSTLPHRRSVINPMEREVFKVMRILFGVMEKTLKRVVVN